ncbi:PREDICTED: uncharacterized protein LOC108565044 [Nicrophorus vespilloides]|uniref:Uncharacterized protein LOC108565044 n=1 Tax=Nicrophorus vespilloides TaxID=110193 RepID=A0ABM1MYY6_NICVS|nr:PREDICTED: uncharacterized protein LOC108565044 [Nicrophorus vespilloides]
MHMEPKDLQVIQMVIHRYYSDTFQRIESLKTPENIKAYLQEKIRNEEQSLAALVEVIHNWFLSMPILLELSKCAGWDYLMFREACLLNVDTLYSILLNLMYGNTQKGSEQMRLSF